MRFLKTILFCFSFFIFLKNPIFAQHIGGSTLDTTTGNAVNVDVPPPSKVNYANPDKSKDSDQLFQEKLVKLALQQPVYDETEHQKDISLDELTKAKQSWLNLLSISANYNDQTFAKQVPTTGSQYVYPKYFFGLTLPIGLFFSRKSDIKIAKDNYAINEDKQKDLALTIRQDVLTRYAQYKTYLDLLTLQNQVIDDQQAVFMQAEQKFKDGSIQIEAYNAAAQNYNNELVKKINTQLEVTTAKLSLEKMIGMHLEDVAKTKTK